MRYLSMLVVITFVFVSAVAFAAVAAADTLTPRPLDPIAVETLASVLEKSESTRSVVRVIEGSNVIVHIVSSPSVPASVGGRTRLVTSRGGYRYVRITINSELPLRWRSAILARELRNAGDVVLQAEPVTKFDH
jgi:hypothetical protein